MPVFLKQSQNYIILILLRFWRGLVLGLVVTLGAPRDHCVTRQHVPRRVFGRVFRPGWLTTITVAG